MSFKIEVWSINIWYAMTQFWYQVSRDVRIILKYFCVLWNQVSRDLRPNNFKFSCVLWNQVSRDLRITTWNSLALWNQVSRALRVKFDTIWWPFEIKWANISDPTKTLDFFVSFEIKWAEISDPKTLDFLMYFEIKWAEILGLLLEIS